jgi:hypothetical protein
MKHMLIPFCVPNEEEDKKLSKLFHFPQCSKLNIYNPQSIWKSEAKIKGVIGRETLRNG